MEKYVTYISEYHGDAFPPKFANCDVTPKKYVGSCKKIKIEQKKYVGSPKSKLFYRIWERERQQNFHLFNVTIIEEFDTLDEALAYELKLQQQYSVVTNPEFFNKRYAQKTDFGGEFYGEKNSACIKYCLTSPDGTEHHIKGCLPRFCKQNELSVSLMKKFINKGVVGSGTIQQNFYKEVTKNCLGWEIKTE